MPRPKRNTRELLEDLFYDLDPVSQAALLQTLHTLHRLKKRQKDPAPKQANGEEGA